MKRLYAKLNGLELRLAFPEKRIASEVIRLADEISVDYAGEELHLIVVLKGAFMFAADLARHIRLPLAVDFVRLASYSGTESTGTVTITQDIESAITGKHVLVVEDIVDTGLTLSFLLENLRCKGPKSLKVCTLLDKRAQRRLYLTVHYAGITCNDGFLVGYGLDLDEQCRELPDIYEVVHNPSSGGLNDSPV